MTRLTGNVAFPCTDLAEDGPGLRLGGLYPQVQEGLWMQRVKVLGGRLTADQWRALAALARTLTPTAPLHLTTRQDIELHDLAQERIPRAQRALDAAGLTGLGACGDTVRNITVCPCSGAASGTVDLAPLAWQIRGMLEATDGVFSLPRKFKISLSACEEGRGRPWINDVGFVARRRSGRWTFQTVVAGSLGAKPATGILFDEALPPEEVLPCVLGLFRVFAAHGDRDHRSRARLRHVRQRQGDERFLTLARDAVAAAKAERAWPHVELPDAEAGFDARLVLTFANGDVTADAAEALADLAERDDLRVRIGNHHRIHLFGRDAAPVKAAVEVKPSLRRAAVPQPAVVACPGKRWCKRGLVDTNALAERIRALPAGTIADEATVCISGCPNGCAHSAVADIGIVGGRTRGDDGPRETFDLLVGGGMGRDDRLAEPVARRLSADQVLEHIARR